MTHIWNSRRSATALRKLQYDGILADRRSQDRDSQIDEEEVDWHEEDNPRAVQLVKKGETPQPTHSCAGIEAAGAHTMVKRLVHD